MAETFPINTLDVNVSLFNFKPDTLVEFYEVRVKRTDSINQIDTFRFHAGINQEGIAKHGGEKVYGVKWQGKVYISVPLETEGFEARGDGRLPRPIIRFANVEGFFSAAAAEYGDFIGAKVVRKRTFAKYLDAENWPKVDGKHMNPMLPTGMGDPNSHLPDDMFFVNRKLSENKNLVEYELVSLLELEGVYLPARMVLSNYCSWVYRSPECGYGHYTGSSVTQVRMGLPVADKEDNLLGDMPDAAGTVSTRGTTGRFTITGVVKDGWKDTSTNEQRRAFVAESNIELWKSGREYKKNEFVFLTSGQRLDTSSDPTQTSYLLRLYYVCRQDHVAGLANHPFYNKEVWAQDQCSKTVWGCKLRFDPKNTNKDPAQRDETNRPPLPFGGFPSTDRYSF
jgi:lambda family phage minor tail protein L